MAKTFRAWEVDQVQLFPPPVRDFVPDDHLGHFVRDTVRNDLDLSSILSTYEEAPRLGRAHHDQRPARYASATLFLNSVDSMDQMDNTRP
jgi:hypothetical protein